MCEKENVNENNVSEVRLCEARHADTAQMLSTDTSHYVKPTVWSD